MVFWGLIALLFLCACSDSQDPIAVAGDLVLRGGWLIDGTGAEPLPDAAVVIQDGRISWVGENGQVPIPEGATVYDLDGAAVLPGFINAHVHGGYDEANLKAWAREGVTTVRDMAAPYRLGLFMIRDGLNADNTNARLVAAGPMVTVPSGYPMVPWGSRAGLPVSSVEEARDRVRQLLDDGADFIKIALERGDSFGRTIPVLSTDMTREIVALAHERGTLVSAHITVARDLELVLDGGADDVAHMAATPVSHDIIQRLVDENIYWVPTLELWHGVGYDLIDVAQDNLMLFVAAGGNVALGTDYDGYLAPFDLGMPIREIGWMEEAGMTPMQIVVAATRNAAHVCNMEAELGTIEVGKIADVLVVNGNPLENLTESLADVRLVVRNGVVIRGNE